jgi:pimeloyl-ACP methyl ester carboxylesterase
VRAYKPAFVFLIYSHSIMKNSTDIKGYSDVNGIRMYYEIYGQGNPLVLIHGGGSTIDSCFGTLMPLLSADHQLIAVELQAHGRTSDRDAPESFEQDADDVVALLKNLTIPKASFFGFSNGGNTTIEITRRHPEVVNKIVLASTFYRREGLIAGLFEGMKEATIEVMPQPLKDAFMKVNPDRAALQNMFNKDRERMLNCRGWDEETLSSISAPTLIINGDRDVILTSHAVEMAGLIRNSRLLILPADHGSYIGVAESRLNDISIVLFTSKMVSNFLLGELP